MLTIIFLALAALLGCGLGFCLSRTYWRNQLLCEIERRLEEHRAA